MFIYTLVAGLIMILVMAYVFSGQDLMSPWVLATGSFFICSFFAMLNLDYWQYDFRMETCLVIFSSLILFGLGTILAEHQLGRAKANATDKMGPVYIPLKFPILAAAVSFVLAAVSFDSLYELSLAYGNVDGYAGVFPTIRKLMEERVIGLPRWQSYRLVFAYGTAVFFQTIFFYNAIFFKLKASWCCFLLPTLAFLPHALLTTGRMDFLKITMAAVMAAGLFYQMKHGISFKTNLKVVGSFLVAGLLFLTLFFSAGSLTWKGLSADRGPFKIVSHYAGAQIPALDVFVNDKYYSEDELVGQMTLIRVYGNLRTLGLDLPQVSPILEYTYFTNVDTNVYTALRSYIQDYGYVGMGLVSFLIGLLCSTLYGFAKYRIIGLYGMMAYVVLCWPVFLYGQNEWFFFTDVNTSALYALAIIYLWYWLMKRYNSHEKERFI